ncbi:hypothetical protein DAPPUDRAFT_331494 [Daphnia pulex]|uniref:Uncharacterized protein n=1 Tax=Daphnia pulex TaxID=6669 RepID=E9HMN0_DAPPU|nr:hypothetical protein DAPPUDRAFT_331494 [Daphnia pulex]|eukprot:EFX67014.1 hypothetical protein DAPPUDRAFT_331494 [Daphnia pulex]
MTNKLGEPSSVGEASSDYSIPSSALDGLCRVLKKPIKLYPLNNDKLGFSFASVEPTTSGTSGNESQDLESPICYSLRRFASLPHSQQQPNASSEYANAAHETFTDATVPKGMIIHASCEELEEATYILRGFEHAVCNALNLPVKIGFPSVEELNRARNYWIHQFQMAAFPDEWWRLKRGYAVKKTSKLPKLQPYLDKKDGIIKIRARTALSETCVSGCRNNFGQDGVVNIYKNVRYTSNRRIQKQNIEVGEVVLIEEDNVKVNHEGWELWLRFTLGLIMLFERSKKNSAEAEYILDAGTQKEESGDEEDGETELGEAESTDPVEREISIPSTSQDSVDVAGRQPLRPASGKDVVKTIVTSSGRVVKPRRIRNLLDLNLFYTEQEMVLCRKRITNKTPLDISRKSLEATHLLMKNLKNSISREAEAPSQCWISRDNCKKFQKKPRNFQFGSLQNVVPRPIQFCGNSTDQNPLAMADEGYQHIMNSLQKSTDTSDMGQINNMLGDEDKYIKALTGLVSFGIFKFIVLPYEN